MHILKRKEGDTLNWEYGKGIYGCGMSLYKERLLV